MGVPDKPDVRYSNGAGDDTKVTFISGNQKYVTDQEKGKHDSFISGSSKCPSVLISKMLACLTQCS